MKKILILVAILISFIAVPASVLAARAHAICKDHTTSYSVNRQGTCSHHKGVLKWLY